MLTKHANVHRFVKLLIARRLLRTTEHEIQRMSLNQLLRQAKCSWHGVKLGQPDWGECSHSIAFSAEMKKEALLLHLIMNSYWEPLDFELPRVENGDPSPWRRWIDTALDSPHDIVEWKSSPPVPGHTYRAEARSAVVLIAALT